MRDNDIIESEYVGWAIEPITTPVLHTSIYITGWKNISESIVMKKISVQIANKNKYHIYNSRLIICAVQVDDNETLSEVSHKITSSNSVEINIFMCLRRVNSLLRYS